MKKGSKHTLKTKLKMRNHTRTMEQRKRMSRLAKLQHRRPPLRTGSIPWNKGKKGLQKAWNKGIRMAEKSKKKLSRSIKRLYKLYPEVKEKISKAVKEIWTNPIYRQKCSDAQKGEKSYLWKGGIQFEPYSKNFSREFKENIKKRDNYKCCLCRKSGIVIHHINYNKKDSLEKNLITLCRNCHSKTNHNREYWKNKLQNLQQQRLSEKTS